MAQEERLSRSFFPPYFEVATNTASCQNPNHEIQVLSSDPEMYAAGLEMMMGFNLSKSTQAEDLIMLDASSSKALNDTDLYEFCNKHSFTDWGSDDSSLKCVLPSPRRGQSLSLSLNSVSHYHHHHHHHLHQQNPSDEDGFSGCSTVIKNSKYLNPARELLGEICSIGIPESHEPKHKAKCSGDWVDNDGGVINISPCWVSSSDSSALLKKKTMLFSMLDQVERRYKLYRDQMKGVVSSFEAVAGKGAALAYSGVASNVMSRHFRRLRDGIVEQIKATDDRIMGGTDFTVTMPRMARGETPRLRILDQSMRQQTAIKQMNMVESSGVFSWRPHRGLPEHSVSVLRAWLFEHFLHPYPSDIDKHILARKSCLSRSQVSNWFINARVRLWKPMVEEMYLEETNEQSHDVNINNIKAAENMAINLPYRNFLAP